MRRLGTNAFTVKGADPHATAKTRPSAPDPGRRARERLTYEQALRQAERENPGGEFNELVALATFDRGAG